MGMGEMLSSLVEEEVHAHFSHFFESLENIFEHDCESAKERACS